MPLGQTFIKGMNDIISETSVGCHDGWVVTLGGPRRFVFLILLNWGFRGSKVTNAKQIRRLA